MKIGIDASRYGHAEATGVEWYSYQLLNELLPLLGRDHNNEVRLYSPRAIKLAIDAPFNVKKRVMPMPRLWTTVRLSLELLLHPVDLLFVPSHILPPIMAKKSVVTIHDVAFRHLKGSYDWLQYFLLQRSTRQAVKKAYKIIVPSNATKNDLIEFYKCDPEKIVVIAHGSPQIDALRSWTESEQLTLRDHFKLKPRDLYILYVGRIETKKNLVRLVEAFKRFLVEFPDWKLVLAGKNGVGYEEVLKKINELQLQKNILLPGYVTEREKSFLMDHCRIFAFPSAYEGFGLPVLEAFAYRKPVLTSNSSALPEVAGGAAVLADPNEVAQISVGLKRLALDGVLVSQMIEKGSVRLKHFSWEKAAKQTYEVLLEENSL